MQRSARKETESELDWAPRQLARAGPHNVARCYHPGLPRLAVSYRDILNIAQATSLSGFTKLQPNSLARAGTWGRVPGDGTGKQEIQDPFS